LEKDLFYETNGRKSQKNRKILAYTLQTNKWAGSPIYWLICLNHSDVRVVVYFNEFGFLNLPVQVLRVGVSRAKSA
jgi:hypothetical protein